MTIFDLGDSCCKMKVKFPFNTNGAGYPCLLKSFEGDLLKVILHDVDLDPESLRPGLEVEIEGLNAFEGEKIKAVVLSTADFPVVELQLLGKLEESTRRNFVRVDDIMRVRHSQISREDFESNKEAYLCSSSARSAVSTLMQNMMYRTFQDADNKAINEALFTLIMTIDRKLDLLLEVLSRPAENSCVEDRVSKVNISGSGIKFLSKRPYEQGQLLKLTIFLPIFPQLSICAVGEVVRSEAVEKEGEKEYQIASRFIAINEDDREQIVCYTFKREREILRNRKYATS